MDEAELEIERQKLELERRRLDASIALQTQESETRLRERRSEWLKGVTPAAVTLLVGLVGGLVALLQAQSQAQQQILLEQIKARNGLILQAMQTGDVQQASKNLLFLAKNEIIDLDIPKLEQSLDKYQPALPSASKPLFDRFGAPEKLPDTIPSQISTVQIPPAATTLPPGKFGSRAGEAVVGIVVHNAFGPEGSVEYLQKGPNSASYHWIILPSGKIVPLVDEKAAAFHIGGSKKSGWTNRTTISVAVAGEAPLSRPEQAAALYALLADICSRWKISASSILTHDAVDPRKNETLEPHIAQIREEVVKRMQSMQAQSAPLSKESLKHE